MGSLLAYCTLDGEDERRVAIGVLRVDIDPRKREQLAGLALTTCGKKRLLTRDRDHSCLLTNEH